MKSGQRFPILIRFPCWPALTKLPPWDWYKSESGPDVAVEKQCQGGTHAYRTCTENFECPQGVCAMPQMTARDYMKNYQ